MRKSLLGMSFALCGLLPATSLSAADYAPPAPAYYPVPVQSSCCCPTVRRGLWVSPSYCGASYVTYPQPAPVYYPGYAPGVGVAVGVRYHSPRKHCWRSHGHWVCR